MNLGEEVELPEQAMANLSLQNDNPANQPGDLFEKDKEKVYFAAKNGHDMTLYSLLADQATPERVRILTESYNDEEDTHNCPPLVIAALKGHLSVVEALVSKVKYI